MKPYDPSDLSDIPEDFTMLSAKERADRGIPPRGGAITKPRKAASAPAASQPGSGPQTGVAIILTHFRGAYRPVFKRGTVVVGDDGEEVPLGVACSVPTSPLIARLADAVDAPRFPGTNGGVKVAALPGFFRTWAKVAWGDLLAELPSEDDAELADDAPAAETFRRLVREALFSEVVLGNVVKHLDMTQYERRPLIHWCKKFAMAGPWRDVRNKACWVMLRTKPGGEVQVAIAIRHELLSQMHADARLRAMGPNRFGRLCAKYGVGTSSRADRPHGLAAVLLDGEFVAAMLEGLPDEEAAGADRPAEPTAEPG